VGWRTIVRERLGALVDALGDRFPLRHRVVVRETACSRKPLAAEVLAEALSLPVDEVREVMEMGSPTARSRRSVGHVR
jgi:hypothetical protein